MGNLSEYAFESGIKKGVRQGIKTGRAVGEAESQLEIIKRMTVKGYGTAEIAEVSGVEMSVVERIRKREFREEPEEKGKK